MGHGRPAAMPQPPPSPHPTPHTLRALPPRSLMTDGEGKGGEGEGGDGQDDDVFLKKIETSMLAQARWER